MRSAYASTSKSKTSFSDIKIIDMGQIFKGVEYANKGLMAAAVSRYISAKMDAHPFKGKALKSNLPAVAGRFLAKEWREKNLPAVRLTEKQAAAIQQAAFKYAASVIAAYPQKIQQALAQPGAQPETGGGKKIRITRPFRDKNRSQKIKAAAAAFR
jgi:hypothetical protein